MNFRVKLTGFKELSARLKELDTIQATRAGRSALRAGAKVMLEATKREAPVGPDAEGSIRRRKRKNGTIREEKHHKIINSLKIRNVRSDSIHKIMSAITAGNAYHASLIEFGSIHNAPNGFMRRALDQSTAAILEAMRVTLNKQLIRRGV